MIRNFKDFEERVKKAFPEYNIIIANMGIQHGQDHSRVTVELEVRIINKDETNSAK